MKKKNFKWSALLTATILSIGLAGCATSANTADSSNETDSVSSVVSDQSASSNDSDNMQNSSSDSSVTEKPSLNMDGIDGKTYTTAAVIGEKVTLPNVTATDEKGNNLSAAIKVSDGNEQKYIQSTITENGASVQFSSETKGTYQIIYTVSDSSGNSDSFTVTVTVDLGIRTLFWDQTNNILETETAEQTDKPAEIGYTVGYSEKVLKIQNPKTAGEISFTGTTGKFVAGHKYRIEFFYYNAQKLDSITVGFLNEGGTEFAKKLPAHVGGHVYRGGEAEATGFVFTATEKDITLGLKFKGNTESEFYLGDFRIIDLTAVSTDPDTSEENTLYWNQTTNILLINNASFWDKPDFITDSHFGDKVLLLHNEQSSFGGYKFFPTKNLFVTGNTYKIDFWYYLEAPIAEEKGQAKCEICYTVTNESGKTSDKHGTQFQNLPTETGLYHFEEEFTATEEDDMGFFRIYLSYVNSSDKTPLRLYIGEVRLTNLAQSENAE